MAEAVLRWGMVEPVDVVTIEIVPTAPPPQGELRVMGGAAPINVRVTLEDRSQHEAPLCGGIPSGPACTEDPTLAAESSTDGGYFDTPCPGEPPVCPSPVPGPEPDAVAASDPIRVPALAIPIDHVGSYEVVVGSGSLPNGLLTRAGFGFSDPWPEDVTIVDAVVTIRIRSLEVDGKPFDNVYEHGWRSGRERIEAVLVFGVSRFDPGAVLRIRDVVVE